MIGKIRDWLRDQFLPEYCRQQLIEENERLREELGQARQAVRERDRYIDGLEEGLRTLRRITIQNNVREGGK